MTKKIITIITAVIVTPVEILLLGKKQFRRGRDHHEQNEELEIVMEYRICFDNSFRVVSFCRKVVLVRKGSRM